MWSASAHAHTHTQKNRYYLSTDSHRNSWEIKIHIFLHRKTSAHNVGSINDELEEEHRRSSLALEEKEIPYKFLFNVGISPWKCSHPRSTHIYFEFQLEFTCGFKWFFFLRFINEWDYLKVEDCQIGDLFRCCVLTLWRSVKVKWMSRSSIRQNWVSLQIWCAL